MDKNAIPKRMTPSEYHEVRKKAPRTPKMIEGHDLQGGVPNQSMIGG